MNSSTRHPASVCALVLLASLWLGAPARARRQPLLLYPSHPAFQQTNAIPGELSEGVGVSGGIERLPLWVLEGMAEYYSVGAADPAHGDVDA